MEILGVEIGCEEETWGKKVTSALAFYIHIKSREGKRDRQRHTETEKEREREREKNLM